MQQGSSVESKVEFEFSNVEHIVLVKSPFDAIYQPKEKIPAIVVESFPELGQLAALSS